MSNDQVTVTAAGSRQEPLLIGAEEVARMLDISPRSVWRLLSAGKLIEPVRIGGNTRWRFAEVRQWIADGCPPPNGTT
jgi:prophage regulatory protein